MARLVYSMNVSLDGYVDHEAFAPGLQLFRYFIDHIAGLTGSVYGRRLYELMHYWDEDQPDWNEAQPEWREARHAFAAAWRRMPKWVASRSSPPVGPNARLLSGDLAAAVGRLKAEHDGEIAVGGPVLAQGLAGTGLIDEYRLILRPVVLGQGRPFFRGALPPLRLIGSERVGEDALCLRYAAD
jgi:dihydrofolate reductase